MPSKVCMTDLFVNLLIDESSTYALIFHGLKAATLSAYLIALYVSEQILAKLAAQSHFYPSHDLRHELFRLGRAGKPTTGSSGHGIRVCRHLEQRHARKFDQCDRR